MEKTRYPIVENPKKIFALDFRSLALFRVMLGGLLIYDLLTRSVDALAFYTDFGLLPRDVFISKFMNSFHLSLHLANGYVGWTYMIGAIHLTAAIMLLFGYRTKLATIICWVLLISLQNRNPMILNAGDVLFRMLLFWAMWLPIGMRYSVDASLATDKGPKEKAMTGIPPMALTCQPIFVYVCTIIFKDGKEWIPDGTATYFALSLDAFVTPFGHWMSQWHEFLRISTYIVFFVEIIGALLLICPFFFTWARTIGVLSLLSIHLSFDLSMRLGHFPYVDAASLLVLMPSRVWDFLMAKIKTEKRRALTIFYDGDCGFCRKSVLLIRTFLLIPETRVDAVQEDKDANGIFQTENSWVVRDASGAMAVRWEALIVVLEHSPLTFWLRFLPLRKLAFLGDRIYKVIADNRKHLSKVTGRLLPYGKLPREKAHWLTSVACLFFLGYVALYNIKTLPNSNVTIRPPFNRVAAFFRLDQKWNMFSPFPTKEDGWYVIEGQLRDKTDVDLWNMTLGKPSYEKPELISAMYSSARWRKYMMNIWQRKNKKYRLYFGKYLCRVWNRAPNRTTEKQLTNFKIHFMLERTPPPGAQATIKKVTIWSHDCYKKSEPTT